MRHRLLGVSLLAMFVLATALAGQALSAPKDKDKKKGEKVATVTADSGKFAAGDFTGKVKSVPGSDRIFVLGLETKALQPTGKGGKNSSNGAVNNILRLQVQIQQANARLARSRNPASDLRQLLSLQMQLQRQMQTLTAKGTVPAGYKVTTTTKEVEFQAAEGVKVRTMLLPEQFDDKGNPKKYTAKELDELKGKDKTLVGYESSLEQLAFSQKVKVTLAPAPAKKAGKDGDKEETAEVEKKMQVKLIVILEEATETPPAKGKPKKK